VSSRAAAPDGVAGFETVLNDGLRGAAVMHHDETAARVAGDDADWLLSSHALAPTS
jgi:hypothetical protein